MKKITKTKFKVAAREGLNYFGSKFTQKDCLYDVLNRIQQVGASCNHKGVRRLLNNNNNSLKFSTETNEYAYLNINGRNCGIHSTVCGSRRFYVIIESIKDQYSIVTYAKEL